MRVSSNELFSTLKVTMIIGRFCQLEVAAGVMLQYLQFLHNASHQQTHQEQMGNTALAKLPSKVQVCLFLQLCDFVSVDHASLRMLFDKTTCTCG